MSLSAKIRQQLISSFHAELSEHVQTMTDGLLALEQLQLNGEQRRSRLEEVFRAAHSLKGAARAVGVTAVEHLAHALENLLAEMQQETVQLAPELFTACYHGLDAIQAIQASYESGHTTPPALALEALAELESLCVHSSTPDSRAPKPVHDSLDLEDGVPDGEGICAESAQEWPAPESSVTRTSPAVVGATPDTPPIGRSHAGDETIRVSVQKLDALMAQLSELIATKIRSEQRLMEVRQAYDFIAQVQKDWLSARGSYSRLARQNRTTPADDAGTHGVTSSSELTRDLSHLLEYVSASQDRLREMSALVGTLAREYGNDTMHSALVIDALEREVKRVRMLPLSTITGAFGRMVRDLAQGAGKEAVLQVVGGEVELDKRVLEQIKDPLIHILRNAVDHGIELPDERARLHKPRSGTIVLASEQLGKNVVITVSDDGAGLDLDSIRQAAAHRLGLDVTASSPTELAELVFSPGFSTHPIITDVSGRGLGLDVVRRNVEALSGMVRVDWQPGGGASFRLTLPLALTSSRALLIRAAGQLFAIPFSAIESIVMIDEAQVSALGGHDALRVNDRPIPLVRLDSVLELPHAPAAKDPFIAGMPVVILAVSERRFAIVVDDLVGEQEMVIKDLGRQLLRVGGVAGATVTGSGEVTLVLNAAELIKLAQRTATRAAPETTDETSRARPRPRILVVDDSITTRTLEKNILEAAGYAVQLAVDGREALNVVDEGDVPDLVISDISMPHLDGFGLTARLKGDARTSNVPVILVTSLDSTQDKTRGIEAGADAYILKGGFDQNKLLETIEQLI